MSSAHSILLYSKKDCPVAAYLRSEGLLHVIVGKAAQSANQTIYIDNDNALAGAVSYTHLTLPTIYSV